MNYSREELISLIDAADKVCEGLVLEVVMDLQSIAGRKDIKSAEDKE